MTEAPAAKTVVIVDDDSDMRLLVRLVLEATGGFEVVAETIDGPEAIATIDSLGPPPVPDVLVLDNRMDEMSGLEVAEHLLASYPGLPIVLFSAYLSREVREQAAALGVAACLSKSSFGELPGLIAEITQATSR